jgi:hypothetical protein
VGGEIGSEHMIHGALAEVMKSALVPPFFVRDLIDILPIAKSTVYYSNDMVPGQRHRTWPCGVVVFPSLVLSHFPRTIATGDNRREMTTEFR